jgi:hypothetical protein
MRRRARPNEHLSGSGAVKLIANIIVNITVFVALAFGGGLATAWYMIEAGSPFSIRSFGPWTAWTSAGRPEADPYTRAHVFRNGLLPLSTTLEVSFRAKLDSSGSRLTSSCDYTLEMADLAPAWWNLAVFDGQGRLISNPAERYAFSSSSAARQPDGRTVVSVSRDARPGNWLPSGRASRIVLVFTVQDAATATTVHDEGIMRSLPEIKRERCR